MKKNKNILLQMHRYEAKAGVRRTSTDHTLGTTAKWVFYISVVWASLMHALYFLSVYIQRGHTLDAQSGKDMSILFEDYVATTSSSLILVGILSLMIIAGAFLLKFRFYILAACFNILPAIVLIFHFKARMSDLFAISDGIPLSFIFRHLLPLALVAAATACYSIIGILFNISENKAYERFVGKIYEQHPDRFGKMTDEEWDSFLSTYEIPSKKEAKKARKLKAKNENNI